MAIEILMPALSPTMEEGTRAKWLVAEGDAVLGVGVAPGRIQAAIVLCEVDLLSRPKLDARTAAARATRPVQQQPLAVEPH